MNISALLTSAGINIGLCALFLALYSILRKQPFLVSVYFGGRLSQKRFNNPDAFTFNHLLPSPAWILKAWSSTEDEIMNTAGLDAVVFLRILVFSMRIFSVAALVCLFVVLPLNYYGQEMHHTHIPKESLDVFTIGNVKEESKWLWAHCLALYTISLSACILLYVDNAERMYKRLVCSTPSCLDPKRGLRKVRCGLCGVAAPPFKLYTNELQMAEMQPELGHLLSLEEKECPAAFVFFKTRYAAVVACQVLQTYNPMRWVINLAPEPHDVYWSNLWLPYRQLWFRRLTTILAAIGFVFIFLIPVTFVQGLSQLEKLQKMFPFLKNILKKRFISQVVTGYLPSVVLLICMYIVPPTMTFFSTVEGCISHSERKRSTCAKVSWFMIWNVFFVNALSGSLISQLDVISNPKMIPTLLAKAVPRQTTFFITYVLSSGWVSLCSELMQGFSLVFTIFMRGLLKKQENPDWVMSFPYHTEVPRVLVFVLLGFTCSILAPLILPFLMVYFFLGYVVYRNQILNVYRRKYETGGQYWPIMHNTVIFSLLLTQIIALGVFGMKKATVASGFTFLGIILTLLFAEFCRQRFRPLFDTYSAQKIIEMDRSDVQHGRMAEIYRHVIQSYRPNANEGYDSKSGAGESSQSMDEGLLHPTIGELSLSKIQGALTWISMLMIKQERRGK